MSVLEKTTTVLDLSVGPRPNMPSEVVFTGVRERKDDSSDSVNDLYMQRKKWEELGMPECITVTIEPGDKLNEEEVSV